MDDAKFFEGVKASLFGGHFTQSQVDGLNAILHGFDYSTDLRYLAYMLATTFHETSQTMQPISEYGGTSYFTRMYDINGSNASLARRLGNVNPGDGALFHGRGYVQLTGRANYDKAGKAVGVDLIANPAQALNPDVAMKIMNVGMVEGWFTGRKLADYFNDTVEDPYDARAIINGDKLKNGHKIAGYYSNFIAALKSAQ